MTIVVALIFLGLTRAIFDLLRIRTSTALQLGVVREIRGKLLQHVLRISASALRTYPSGELASRVQVEVHGVRLLLYLGLSQGLRSLLVVTALATLALRVDTALAIPALVALPAVAVLVRFGVGPARRFQRELLSAETEVISRTTEAIDGALVLRAYQASTATARAVDEAADASVRAGIRAESWSVMLSPMVELLGAVAVASALAVAWSTRSSVDVASAGTVLAAMVLLYRPLQGLAQATFAWWSGLATLDRIDELLALPVSPVSTSEDRTTSVQTLELERVSFAYADEPVLAEVTLQFETGELVVVCGESGSGKSTLLGILGGILDPTRGEVTYDGQRASAAKRAATAAWMSQTPQLFHGTVLENITLGDPKPSRGQALLAAERAGVDSFVHRRPGGFESLVADGGRNLSVGQRQRLTLARALYRQAPILLLDEPTAALGAEQEREVVQLCRAIADRGALVVVASHREDFRRVADRVLEVRHARVHRSDQGEDHVLLH
ncbi:MAG: ABC transporter ATP-binding protein [Myxococcota bacterium]